MVKKKKKVKVFEECYALECWMPDEAMNDALKKYQNKFEKKSTTYVQVKTVTMNFKGASLRIKVTG